MDFDNDDLLTGSKDIDKFEDEIDVSESKTSNRVTQLQQLISHFEYRLMGFKWKSNGEHYYYAGEPLAGEDTIQQIIGILHPFSREIIMISSKKDYEWQLQMLKDRLEIAAILTKAADTKSSNLKLIWRMYSDMIFNIGHIIGGDNSLNFLKGYFGIENNNSTDREFRTNSNYNGVNYNDKETKKVDNL